MDLASQPSTLKPTFFLAHNTIPKVQAPFSTLSSPRSRHHHPSWWPCCHMLGLSSFSCSGTSFISLWGRAGHKRRNQPFPACNYVLKTHRWHPRYATTPERWAPVSGFWGTTHTAASRHSGTWYVHPRGQDWAVGGQGQPGPPKACVCSFMAF